MRAPRRPMGAALETDQPTAHHLGTGSIAGGSPERSHRRWLLDLEALPASARDITRALTPADATRLLAPNAPVPVAPRRPR